MTEKGKIRGAVHEIDREVSHVSAESITSELENDGIYVKRS